MRPYTQKEKATLRRLWREEFGARNPEHLDTLRPPPPNDDFEPPVVMGPRGYCELWDDGTVITFGVIQDLFD